MRNRVTSAVNEHVHHISVSNLKEKQTITKYIRLHGDRDTVLLFYARQVGKTIDRCSLHPIMYFPTTGQIMCFKECLSPETD